MAFTLGGAKTGTGFAFGTSNAASTTPAPTSLFAKPTATTLGTPATSTASLFGATAPASSAPATGLFNTGATTSAVAPKSLFGAPAASAASTSLFGAPASTAVTTAAVPEKKEEAVTLGGIRSDTAKVNGGPKAWKNEVVPAPVCALIDDFKKFLKEQKDLKDEIARFSPASIDKAKEEVEYLTKNVRYLDQSIRADTAAVTTLKTSVMAELKNCELAQRASDSSSLEVSQPLEYFYKLVYQFEEAIQLYKVQIEEVESVMGCERLDPSYSPQHVGAMLHRMHQIFVTLASKLHGLHEDLKTQKDFYLNYRKVIYKDDSNIFESRRKNRLRQVCPTPFSDTTNTLTSLQQVNLSTAAAVTSNVSLFNTTITQPSFNSSFALQPAPLGIKKKR